MSAALNLQWAASHNLIPTSPRWCIASMDAASQEGRHSQAGCIILGMLASLWAPDPAVPAWVHTRTGSQGPQRAVKQVPRGPSFTDLVSSPYQVM